MSTRTVYILAMLLIGTMAMQCPRKMSRLQREKIQFDYSKIDSTGLRRGESAVDYEFCIPAHTLTLAEVQAIEPDVRVLKSSKGRVGCSDTEWLCIVNTHDPDWRRKLYAIAALSYVQRIEETFYE